MSEREAGWIRRATAGALAAVLVGCLFVPFATLSDGTLPASGLAFLFMSLLDLYFFGAWATDMMTGKYAFAGLPLDLINLSPMAEILAIWICALVMFGRRAPLLLSAATVLTALTTFHATFAMDQYRYANFLVGSYIWGAACIATAALGALIDSQLFRARARTSPL